VLRSKTGCYVSESQSPFARGVVEGETVRILEYANDGKPSAFAFSNASFRFDGMEGGGTSIHR